MAQGSRIVGIGQGHYVVVDFLFPGYGLIDRIYHTVFAGGYYSLGLDTFGDASTFLLEARGEQHLLAQGMSVDPLYSDESTGDKLNIAALEYLDNVERQDLELGALLHNVQVKEVSEALTGQDIRIEYVGGVLRFRPIGWFVDAQRVIARHFAVDGDESDLDKKWKIAGLSGSYLEHRLWEIQMGALSVSTVNGLQFANQVGIPIYTINQTNLNTLLPTLNVYPAVRQAVIDAVNAGRVVTIPRDTLYFDAWVGSVWIDDLPGGLSTGYLIYGGLLGGTNREEPIPGENPDCAALSDGLGSDEARAVAWQETGWRQFDDDKQPINRKGDIGIMQVNAPTWVKEDTNGNPIPTVDIDGDGRKDPVNLSQLQDNWSYNVDVGKAIYFREYQPKAQAHLDSLVGPGNYTAVDLLTETYFLYNHGGGAKTPEGTKINVYYHLLDENNQLTRADYSAELAGNQLRNVIQKQNNAEDARAFFEALQANPGQDPVAVLEPVKPPHGQRRASGC